MPSELLYTRIEDLAAPIAALQQRLLATPTPASRGICGFDGFIDTFIRVTAPNTLLEFGQRAIAAAGISASYPVNHDHDKFGGNGPLLAGALHDLLSGRAEVTYIGALGDTEVLPIFRRAIGPKTRQIFTIADPAHSDCLEFNDGKIMLSDLRACAQITWARVLERVGPDTLDKLLLESGFVAAVNWGKLVNVGTVWENLSGRLKSLGVPAKKVLFFMDLAEFEQRPVEDTRELVSILGKITAQCRTMLSFNLKEAWQMAEVFGGGFHGKKAPKDVLALTLHLKQSLNVDWVVVHPNDGAACATERAAVYVPGPFCRNPLISTGAGDHFGAGALGAALRGEDELGVLLMGALTSGYFVRSGISPSLEQIGEMAQRWLGGNLPERL
jgi:hypothetical protein